MIESVASWFTPTILFCFLNLMIGTIFITSNLKTDKKQQQQQPQLTRSPSLLHRVKSFNFSFPDPFCSTTHDLSHNSQPQPQQQIDPTPSLLQRVKSIDLSFSRLDRPDPIPSVAQYADPNEEQVHKVETQIVPGSHVTRSKSATCVVTTTTPAKVTSTRTMVKSASEKKMPVMEKEAAEEGELRRPATMRETVSYGEDEAVDSKADDFINMFRNQLKLQRLDSIIRYKDMLNRGAAR